MAIEKTVFSATAGANRLAELRAWLAENATDYFDTVTEISSSSFYCKKDNKNVLRFITGSSQSIYTYLSNGSEKSWRCDSNFNADYAVKTSKGILLHTPSDADTTSMPNSIYITKTQNDGLAIVVVGTLFDSTDYNEYCSADFEQTPSWAYYVRASKNADGLAEFKRNMHKTCEMTVLQPIPCKSSATYAVGLYHLFYNQYLNAEGIITANGKNYYSNGYLALEE